MPTGVCWAACAALCCNCVSNWPLGDSAPLSVSNWLTWGPRTIWSRASICCHSEVSFSPLFALGAAATCTASSSSAFSCLSERAASTAVAAVWTTSAFAVSPCVAGSLLIACASTDTSAAADCCTGAFACCPAFCTFDVSGCACVCCANLLSKEKSGSCACLPLCLLSAEAGFACVLIIRFMEFIFFADLLSILYYRHYNPIS